MEDDEFGLDLESPTCPRCRITMRLRDGMRWTCPALGCPWGEKGFSEEEILAAKKKLYEAAVASVGGGEEGG